jgi:hypothetical protein
MNKDGATFLIFVGFLITFGGVGGIEVSQTNTEMLGSMIVAIVGLATSFCGVLAMKVLDR